METHIIILHVDRKMIQQLSLAKFVSVTYDVLFLLGRQCSEYQHKVYS